MYSVVKGDFVIVIQKQDKGIKVRLGNGKDKRYFCLTSSSKKRRVYTFEKDWVLLDTSTLEHDLEGECLKNDISDLFQVLLLYPVNERYLELEYDQTLFLEELSEELYLGNGKVKSLPHSNEYEMKDGTVTFMKDGCEHIYTMPSANGLSKADFIKQGTNYPIPLKEDTESDYETDEAPEVDEEMDEATEVDDAETEVEEEKTEVNEEVDDAETEVDDAETEVDDADTEVDDAETEVEDDAETEVEDDAETEE
tara:strand:- start:661 stop:1419 length:759 start_codon:yes stop_codon:yes gene_type:complete